MRRFLSFILIAFFCSCFTKNNKEQHIIEVQQDTISEPELGQTGMNISSYEDYLRLEKVLDSTHKVVLNKYKTCEFCYDAADSLRNTQIYKGLIKKHTSWKALQDLDDDILGNVYDRGSMRGGVMNINRIHLIKSQLAFYELFY